MDTHFYTKITDMEPLFPSDDSAGLDDLAVKVIRTSAALADAVHPITRKGIVELVRTMNSYYSNLIEGHNTHPVDIERALRKDFSHDPAKRARQLESSAHIDVQKLVEKRVAEDEQLNVVSEEFICWIHKEFYKKMPDEYLKVPGKDGHTKSITPGELRSDHVEVGRHLPPHFDFLKEFLRRFEEGYNPSHLSSIRSVVAAAASHHRLAWIHPFLDGNGRVTRLVTHAYLKKAQIDGDGLWTVSRGFARNRDRYVEALESADQHRRGDLDGRGNLSNAGLLKFCQFFLDTALDQIQFMSELLELDSMLQRIKAFVDRQVAFGNLKYEAGYLLQDVFLRGEITRGEIPRIMGLPERTARRITASLLKEGYLVSETEKGPVRLGFPTSVIGYYFPRLYPAGVEDSLEVKRL